MAGHIKVEADYYNKWISLLKKGKLREVLVETEGIFIKEEKALECIVTISQHAYKNLKENIPFESSADDILHTTVYFCSVISLQSLPKNIIRYLTGLYHIVHFFFEMNKLEHVTSIFKIIVNIKVTLREAYHKEGMALHEPYVCLLRKTLMKCVMQPNATTILSFLLEMLMVNQTLENGMLFLKSMLQAYQIADKQDQKSALHQITFGLGLLYKVHSIKDTNLCFPFLLKICVCLFNQQLKIGYSTAIEAVDAHLNRVKPKFSDTKKLEKYFLLLSNSVKLFKWNSTESVMLANIQDASEILKTLNKSCDDSYDLAVCSFIIALLVNSHKTSKQVISALPKTCLEPFLNMILDIYYVSKKCKTDEVDGIHCLSEIFVFISDSGTQYDVKLLKCCVKVIIQAENHIMEILGEMMSTNHSNYVILTNMFLVRCANLIRIYHLAALKEEVIAVSRPICKFICSLPNDVFDDIQIQLTTEVCFTYFASALGIEQLDKVLECIVAWLSKCPKSSKKAFRLWGDLKHNKVCEGKDDGLDTTVWTIVAEKKASLESEWVSCPWSSADIGSFLIQELKTYFVNNSLRGTPVIAAANHLLALDTDCLTTAKGLVIAMDIASANNLFTEECIMYFKKSKLLITKLRKQKKHFDPVYYNCCVGDLLYAQLRCQLKLLRKDCEIEVVRLTIAPHQPLVEELPENRPDPNDTCDVTTKFNNLCLSKQRKIMQDMDSALRHWEFASSLLYSSSVSQYDFGVTLANLQDAGFLLKLYCDEMKEKKVWQLLYRMATVVNDAEKIVIAVGEMMSLQEDIDEDYINNAEKYLRNGELSDKVKQAYLLNSSLYSLYNSKIVEGIRLLHDLENEVNKPLLQRTKFLMNIGRYQQLCDWTKYNHMFDCSPSYHFSFHKALSYLLYLASEKKWGNFTEACQLHCQLLHVACILGESNWCLEQPREARCYLKSQLSLAQKLALPLRTIQLLVLLAWVDLNTGVVDDCLVKLEGLEELLELCGTPVFYGQSSPCHKLNKALISKPEYLSHPESCVCLPCTTVEYRRLVLETVTLRAVFCATFGQLQDALQCFQVATQVQEDLYKSRNSEVLKSCARMWLRYADVMASSEKYKEALTANSKALKLIFTVRDPNTLEHVLEQRCSIEADLQLQYSPLCTKITIDLDRSILSSSLKTPTNKIVSWKSPLAPVDKNIPPITPFARPVRPLKIASSGEENTPPVTVSKTKRKTKISKFVLETPQSNSSSIKLSRTPFVIVDDDGNAVGVTKSKSDLTKKKLFSSDKFNSDMKPKLESNSDIKPKLESPKDIEIIRKSRNRKLEVRTYGRETLSQKKDFRYKVSDKIKTETKENKNGDIFSFDQLKNVVKDIDDVIENTPPKSTRSYKFTSSYSGISSSKNITVPIQSHIDCDLIEGTPPKPSKTAKGLKVKRTTRSNKL